MDTFIYNSFVTGKHHLGRKREALILNNLLTQGEDVVIYEPPKSGITSLVQQTIFNMKVEGKNYDIVQMPLLNIRSGEVFIKRLGAAVIKLCSSTISEYADMVGKYFEGTHFIFDPRAFSEDGTVLSLNWDMEENDIRAVIRLPYRIAADYGKRIIVQLEDFQNIMLCDCGDRICHIWEGEMKKIADEEGGGKSISWLFCGNRLNAMKDIFENKRYFYRLVSRVTLPPLESKDIVEHIVREFLVTGKVVEREQLQDICELFRNNMWLINHYCAICNSLTRGFLNDATIQEAMNCLIAIHEPRFKAMIDDCTTFQIQMLHAILDGHRKFSSAEVIRNYSLSSSANVRRLKDALCKKEIVTFDGNDDPSVIDPLFEYWLEKYYFGIQKKFLPLQSR